ALLSVLQESGMNVPGSATDRQTLALSGMLDDYVEWKGAVANRDEILDELYDNDQWHEMVEERIRYEEAIGAGDMPLLQMILWMDDEGNIIPSPQWQADHPNYCSDQGKYMRAAHKRLVFTLFGDPQIREVYLKLEDVETGATQKAAWGKPGVDDQDWKKHGMAEAWNKMKAQTTIKDFVGPCESEKEYTLYFDSKMKIEKTTENGLVIMVDRVKGSIALSFDNEQQVYTGSGEFEWVESYSNIPYDPYSFLGLTKDFRVLALVTPDLANGNNDYFFPGMDLQYGFGVDGET